MINFLLKGYTIVKYYVNGRFVSVQELREEISNIEKIEGGVLELIDIIDDIMFFETSIYGIYE